MKRYLTVILAIAFLSGISAREVHRINDNWEFFFGNYISSDHAQRVTLPHTWNADTGATCGDYLRGLGNYLKVINIPADWQGRRVFLRFYGAATVADVAINGRYVGTHRGAGTAFTFEITDKLHYGASNSIRVLVNNAQQTDIFPLALEENCYGGLYRDVELIVTDDVAVSPVELSTDGIFVTPHTVSPERVEGQLSVGILSGFTEKQGQLRVAILSPERDTVFRDEVRTRFDVRNDATTITVPFEIEHPELWGTAEDEQPLYTVVAALTAGGSTDSVAVRTGFRTISFDDGRYLRLNGAPFRMHGVALYGDRAGVGSAMLPQHIREDMDIIEESGANTVRMVTQPASPQYFDECDRRGIAVWCDIPLVNSPFPADCAFTSSPALAENGRQQLREIIAQNYNRPSVIMWGIFSKLIVPGDDPQPYIRQLDSLAHAMDGSRPTVAVSNQDGDINFITDLIVWEKSYGWTGGDMRDLGIWQEALHKGWSDLVSGLTYSAGGSPLHQDSILQRPRLDRYWHPERWQTRFHESYLRTIDADTLFWGVVAGNMFDFGSARRTQIDGKGINDCGLVTFDRSIRKDAFYLYKARWNRRDPFVYITERRWARRSNPVQTVTVYSNQPQVELIVNGRSQGMLEAADGIFVWKDIKLSAGDNTIEATVPDSPLIDRTTVTVGRTLQ